ncbi:hypothetical protein C8J57DRAFT_578510 [Mycena rebaudengoi]|nr:hypothetical protein C8J57DRAFT_578510 [Mycena rebaudengoi]
MELDLCELLHSMKLGQQKTECTSVDVRSPHTESIIHCDSNMADAPTLLPDETLMQSKASSPCEPAYQGCAYLQCIQSQLHNYPTTGGEYIESIFTHRQNFFAFPGGHRCCARAFSDIACALQLRDWRADRDADMEAVTAFNFEALLIASVLS